MRKTVRRNKIPGVSSLLLFFIAVSMAGVRLFHVSCWLGIFYIAAACIGAWRIIHSFCAGCPCKTECAHVLPGKAAMRYRRKPRPYTGLEMAELSIAMTLIMGLPQIWLWQQFYLFLFFWTVCLTAVALVIGNICRSCSNEYCPVKRMVMIKGLSGELQ